MFIGEYQHTIDQKGRMAIPAKFRARLTKGAVVTKGLDDCLFLYPKEAWEQLAGKLGAMTIARADSRAFSRLMLAGAMEVDIDKQGRALIPDYLRQYAGIKKTVIVAGLYDRLELWDQDRWNQYKQGTERKSGDIAEALGELGV